MARVYVIETDPRFKNIASHWNELRKREELVDFTLSNDLGNEVKGHMTVMAVLCPIIKSMANSSSNERNLLLRNVSAEAMEQLINFMYTGEIEISINTAQNILIGAVQLRLILVQRICTNFMRVNQLNETYYSLPRFDLRRFD